MVISGYQERVTWEDRTEVEERNEPVVFVGDVRIEFTPSYLTEGAHVIEP